MNEPKKRGRPPKARLLQPVEPNANIDAQVLAAMDRIPREDTPFVQLQKQKTLSQLYAERVWNGQSSDVPRHERLRRVKLALDGQGLPFEGVELP